MAISGVLNISPHLRFVDALALGLLERADGNSEALATMRVLLPTRRACRSLREAFLRLSNGSAMLLPEMLPLGDVDGDELLIEGFDSPGLDPLEIAPAIDATRRTLMLAKLVMAKDTDTTPDQAVRLAQELANLIDQAATERLELNDLSNPEFLDSLGDLSQHWNITVNFLKIVTQNWPDILQARGVLDPATRRNLLLEARAKSWSEKPPQGPVIAAGSTGSIPATADLLKVVAGLPQGCVVLPGLDQHLGDDVWKMLDAGHPQFGLAQLLKHLNLKRSDIRDWPVSNAGLKRLGPTHPERHQLLSNALVPAEGAAIWREQELPSADALAGVTRIDAPNPQDEATAIALVMRRTLDLAEKTAALVTPDRGLARRVTSELKRWGMDVDDSAGVPLSKTPPGVFFELAAEMVAKRFHPVSLLACLKHPLASTMLDSGQLRPAVRALEVGLLRGVRPGEGIEGLQDAYRVLNQDKYKPADLKRRGLNSDAIRDVLEFLKNACGPFAEALEAENADARELLKLHVQTCENLSADQKTGSRLWAADAGEALSVMVAELDGALAELNAFNPRHYPALVSTLMVGRPVRSRAPAHPRLSIWGLLEARLQNADVMILGGLNENTWPAEAKASPWMSRPMQKRFGLALPERRIGLSAHDFQQAFGASEVFLTRSERVDGTPQVPSRWLVRLATMIEGSKLEQALKPDADTPWLSWVLELSRTRESPRPQDWEPRPMPPVALRPKGLSVTRIETWVRDPYAIYAEYILKLKPLDQLDADPGAADRGNIIHDALERFMQAHPKTLPAKAEEELLRIGQNAFKELVAAPTVKAFWWPRFERIAGWFVEFERARRDEGQSPLEIEARGKIDIGKNKFVLSARADRIDRTAGGALVVMDYKTGQPPSDSQVEAGLNPQLPLEAAIIKHGGFEGVDKKAAIDALVYIHLSGGRKAGVEKVLDLDPEAAATEALSGLKRLIKAFDKPKTPYLSRPRPQWQYRFARYDHLARFKEWGSAEGGDT